MEMDGAFGRSGFHLVRRKGLDDMDGGKTLGCDPASDERAAHASGADQKDRAARGRPHGSASVPIPKFASSLYSLLANFGTTTLGLARAFQHGGRHGFLRRLAPPGNELEGRE